MGDDGGGHHISPDVHLPARRTIHPKSTQAAAAKAAAAAAAAGSLH